MKRFNFSLFNIETNFSLKVCSLIIAVLLSFVVNALYVRNDNNQSVLQLIIPVEIKNVPPEKMIIWPLSRQVEVTLQGPPAAIARMGNPVFRLSLPDGVLNRYLVRLTRQDLPLPDEIEILSMTPSEIEFNLDNKITKSLPIVVPKIGSVKEDFKLDLIKVEPPEANITGPEQELRTLVAIETVPLDLRDVDQTIQRQLDVRQISSLSQIEPSKVVVHLDVSSVQSDEWFDKIPVEIRSTSPENITISPVDVRVKVSGPKTVIKTLKKSDIVAYVRIEKLEVWPIKMNVKVDMPHKLNLIVVEPSEIEINKIVPASVKEIKGKK